MGDPQDARWPVGADAKPPQQEIDAVAGPVRKKRKKPVMRAEQKPPVNIDPMEAILGKRRM